VARTGDDSAKPGRTNRGSIQAAEEFRNPWDLKRRKPGSPFLFFLPCQLLNGFYAWGDVFGFLLQHGRGGAHVDAKGCSCMQLKPFCTGSQMNLGLKIARPASAQGVDLWRYEPEPNREGLFRPGGF
jgi:hypothetical protein